MPFPRSLLQTEEASDLYFYFNEKSLWMISLFCVVNSLWNIDFISRPVLKLYLNLGWVKQAHLLTRPLVVGELSAVIAALRHEGRGLFWMLCILDLAACAALLGISEPLCAPILLDSAQSHPFGSSHLWLKGGTGVSWTLEPCLLPCQRLAQQPSSPKLVPGLRVSLVLEIDYI